MKQALTNPQTKLVLRLRGITKRFGNLIANDAIDLDLNAGEILVLLGENGAGKSTLMSILFGHYTADAGAIEVDGRSLPSGVPAAALAAGIGMVHQHFTLADNLTVLQNIVLGTESLFSLTLALGKARRKLADLSARFGFDVDADARVGDLSVGERQRVEILKALYRDVRVLILDEPTAVLTPQEAASLHTTLRQLVAQGLAVIFISHKLDEVLDVGDRIVVLRGGRVVGEVLPRDVDRRALAALMLGHSVEEPVRHSREVGAKRIELDGISVRDASGRLRLSDVSLTLNAGEILGVAGISGNGQSQLAGVLGGLILPETGRYRLDGEDVTGIDAEGLVARGIGRIPEDRHASGVFGDMTIAETLIAEAYGSPRFSRMRVLKWREIRHFAAEAIAKFSVDCERLDMPARLLSGGNLQKLLLARALTARPRFLVAHQPTRGLDVGAAAYVQSQLLEVCRQGAAVLLISDDLDEILTLADRVAVIFRGRLSSARPRDAVVLEELGMMMAGQLSHELSHAT